MFDKFVQTTLGTMLVVCIVMLMGILGLVIAGGITQITMRDSPRWCDWCNGITLFEMPQKYKGVNLCRQHFAKATVVGAAGQLEQ